MKSSELLERAAQAIERRERDEVCAAMFWIAGSEENTIWVCYACFERIAASLRPYLYVHKWLAAHHPAIYRATDIRAYRVAWCRWMAEGYRAIGD